MNTKNLLIASLVGAVIITLFANTPVLNLTNLLLCLPFWGGALLAVYLYRRMTGTVTLGQATWIGTLAGIFAGVLGLILSVFNLAGAGGLMAAYSRYMPPESTEQLKGALSGVMAVVFNIFGLFFNIIFGALGGLLGGALFRPKVTAPATPPLPPTPPPPAA